MITVNLCTIESRKHVLPYCINSLKNQTVKPDKVRIYANDYKPCIEDELVEVYVGEDRTDRSKLHWVQETDGFYISADDDLLYPPDYIEKTLEAHKKYPRYLLTYHGRKLVGKGRNYYKGHKTYHFLQTQNEDVLIDIPGTGVSAFHTSLFIPDIIQYPEQKMADVLMGLECAKAKIPVVCLSHERDWVRSMDAGNSIYNTESRSCGRQGEICDKIYDMKY